MLLFVVYSVGLFLVFSVLAIAFQWSWTPFNRVNLVSELIRETDIAESNNDRVDSIVVADSLPASLPKPMFEL